MYAPQKFGIPKEKALLCLFSFGITHFWGAAFISDFTVDVPPSKVSLLVFLTKDKQNFVKTK